MGNLTTEGSGVRAPGCDESILISIKKMLGLDANYDAYNTDIIVFINSAMMTLQQLGVGPEEGFVVTGLHEMWSDFLPSDTMLEGVKSYIYLCVKMVFDPPTSSYVMESMKAQKEELEWRIREQAEFYPGDGSRKGYYQKEEDIDLEAVARWNEIDTMDQISGFRARGGRYASDPDFPWADGPAQPAIAESEDDG